MAVHRLVLRASGDRRKRIKGDRTLIVDVVKILKAPFGQCDLSHIKIPLVGRKVTYGTHVALSVIRVT